MVATPDGILAKIYKFIQMKSSLQMKNRLDLDLSKQLNFYVRQVLYLKKVRKNTDTLCPSSLLFCILIVSEVPRDLELPYYVML